MKTVYRLIRQGASFQEALDACADFSGWTLAVRDRQGRRFASPAAPGREGGFPAGAEQSEGLQVPLSYRGVPLGTLYVPDAAGAALTDGETEALRDALSLAAYLNRADPGAVDAGSPLSALFTKAYLSKVELKELLLPYGIYGFQAYRLFFLMPDRAGGGEEALLRETFCGCFDAAGWRYALCLCNGIPICLTDGSTPCDESGALYGRLMAFARAHDAHVFVSSRFTEIMGAKEKLRHCEFLMKCVTEVSSPVIFMDRFNMFDLLLSSGLSAQALRAICAEKVLSIKRFDDENGTDYLRTLRTYLVFNRNLKEAGAALHVHPNTVLYRIHAMERKFSFDLTDTVTVFSFTVSFYIMLFLGVHDPI